MLLALIAQLGLGASVPRIDPVLQIAGVEALCHTVAPAGDQPSPAPLHSSDCLICPLCVTAQAPAAIPIAGTVILRLPFLVAIKRPELPPPATAPPSPHRPPSQPRAPPIVS